MDDTAKVFASFVQSQTAVLKELSVRIRALEQYLKQRDASFWSEYDSYLQTLRKGANDASDALNFSDDALN
jgi:hypothetical protein